VELIGLLLPCAILVPVPGVPTAAAVSSFCDRSLVAKTVVVATLLARRGRPNPSGPFRATRKTGCFPPDLPTTLVLVLCLVPLPARPSPKAQVREGAEAAAWVLRIALPVFHQHHQLFTGARSLALAHPFLRLLQPFDLTGCTSPFFHHGSRPVVVCGWLTVSALWPPWRWHFQPTSIQHLRRRVSGLLHPDAGLGLRLDRSWSFAHKAGHLSAGLALLSVVPVALSMASYDSFALGLTVWIQGFEPCAPATYRGSFHTAFRMRASSSL